MWPSRKVRHEGSSLWRRSIEALRAGFRVVADEMPLSSQTEWQAREGLHRTECNHLPAWLVRGPFQARAHESNRYRANTLLYINMGMSSVRLGGELREGQRCVYASERGPRFGLCSHLVLLCMNPFILGNRRLLFEGLGLGLRPQNSQILNFPCRELECSQGTGSTLIYSVRIPSRQVPNFFATEGSEFPHLPCHHAAAGRGELLAGDCTLNLALGITTLRHLCNPTNTDPTVSVNSILGGAVTLDMSAGFPIPDVAAACIPAILMIDGVITSAGGASHTTGIPCQRGQHHAPVPCARWDGPWCWGLCISHHCAHSLGILVIQHAWCTACD